MAANKTKYPFVLAPGYRILGRDEALPKESQVYNDHGDWVSHCWLDKAHGRFKRTPRGVALHLQAQYGSKAQKAKYKRLFFRVLVDAPQKPKLTLAKPPVRLPFVPETFQAPVVVKPEPKWYNPFNRDISKLPPGWRLITQAEHELGGAWNVLGTAKLVVNIPLASPNQVYVTCKEDPILAGKMPRGTFGDWCSGFDYATTAPLGFDWASLKKTPQPVLTPAQVQAPIPSAPVVTVVPISSAVAKLEDDLETCTRNYQHQQKENERLRKLIQERENTIADLKRGGQGNIVLVLRNGFSQVQQVPFHYLTRGDPFGSPGPIFPPYWEVYQQPPVSASFVSAKDATYSMANATVTKLHFRYTGNQDAFGRAIYQQQ